MGKDILRMVSQSIYQLTVVSSEHFEETYNRGSYRKHKIKFKNIWGETALFQEIFLKHLTLFQKQL